MGTSGFYKQHKGQWIYAANRVSNSEYTLSREDKDSYELPIDGWDWYDETPVVKSEFELWEERLDAIAKLKEQGKDSVLTIPIATFYEESQEAISEFIKSGSNTFLIICETSAEAWLDMRESEDSDSPREVLISTLTPLIISK